MKNARPISTHRYEVIFSIFLFALAFLFRDNPHLEYPHILYLIVALLGLNLGAGFVLREDASNQWVPAVIIVSNCAVVTAILCYSGGPESNLWVLYLLPIYTGCLLLTRTRLILIVAGIVAFNAGLCAIAAGQASASWVVFNFLLKSALFIFASCATWIIAERDRAARSKITVQREELERMSRRNQEQEAALAESERMADIGQVTSGISHDIKNPLTVILGTVRLLMEEHAELKADLERIERAAELCHTIANNVLSFARDEEMAVERCRMENIAAAAIEVFEPLAGSSLRIETSFDLDAPPIFANPVHLQRVFMNLISNARAAMNNRGTIRLRTRGYLGVANLSWVEAVVEDTGPGLPEEILSRIFKPFNTSKPADEGTGLGLYLCRQIAAKHRGRLTAENRAEGGARFTLTLPAAVAVGALDNVELRAA